MQDDRYRLLMSSLKDSFRRIADTFTIHHVSKQTVRMRAIMAYSRTFQETEILRQILHRCIRDHEAHVAERMELDPELTGIIGEVAEWCREFMDRVPEDRFSDSFQQDDFYQRIDDATDNPIINGDRVQVPMNHFTQWREVKGSDEVPGLRIRLDEALSALKGQDRWLDLVDASEPWKGARIVQVFGTAAENVKPRGSTAREVVTARKVHKALHNTGFSWNEIGLLGVANDDYAYSALSRFHDYVMAELASRRVELDVFTRYTDRIMRFEHAAYLQVIENRRPRTSQDEEELKRRLNLYLHDAGFNPLPEVPSGPARADALVLAEPWVAYEAKVVRPKDRKGVVEKRLRQGLRQAVDYRRRWQLDLSHLVVFDAWQQGIDMPSRVEMEGGLLGIHIVNLKGAPSRQLSWKAAVRWSVKRVIEEALG